MTEFAYPTILLAGEPVLASSVAQWSLRPGVEPVIEAFDFAPRSRDALARFVGRPDFVTLAYRGRAFEHLLVVREDPAANENLYRVLVADRRYLWRFRHVHERLNLRRRVGVRRRAAWDAAALVASSGDRSAIEQLAATFAWRRWTLAPDDRPWRPVDALRMVLGRVDRGAPVTIDSRLASLQTPIEDLELDDPGSAALNRLLHYVPGAALTVDPDGGVRVYLVPADEDEAIRADLAPEIVGGEHVIRLGATMDRPSKIRVKFSWQVEVRFDFVTDVAGTEDELAFVSARGIVTPRRLENVVEVPDHRLALPDGREVAQGTWLTFAEAWEAWIAQDPPTGSIGRGIRTATRAAFIPELGLWGALDLWGRYDEASGIEAGALRNWTARMLAIQAHYRTSFRLPKDWVDRVYHLAPYLIGTWDRVSGQRAAAVAYGGYAVRPSQKGFFLESRRGARGLDYAINVPGYPGVDAPITSAFKPSPAKVAVLDEDQGVIRLDYRISQYGVEDMVWPSMLQDVPTRDPDAHGARSVAWNAVTNSDGAAVPQLAESHAVAVILTVTPATTILYEIEVTPRDVLPLLPASVRQRLGDTDRGPVLDLRIGPGIESARVAWSDVGAHRDAIEAIFYPEAIDEIRDDPARKDALLSARVRPVVTNDAEQADLGDHSASLRNIALAAAASVWARWTERPIGEISGPYDGGLRLGGAAAALEHTTEADGVSVTRATFPYAIEPLSMFGLMDASTRRILMRSLDGNL